MGTSTNIETGKEALGKAIGRIASGVHIVTACNKEEQVGMLASWIQQAAFHPPTVSVAIHPERELYKVIQQTGCFTINVVSPSNTRLMRLFSKYQPDQFKQTPHTSGRCGLILKEAVAYMDCVVKTQVSAGDHVLVVAEVVDGDLINPELEPMMHVRKSGFSY